MKRFLLLIFLGATCAFGAANDVIISQVKPTGIGNIERRVTSTPDSLIGFDASGHPVNVTAGTGVTISANQISARGGSAGFPLTDSTAIAPSTATPRITLANSAAATVGNPRYSPFIEQDGFTYNSVGGSKSMRFKYGVETRSNSGGTQAGEWVIDASLDGGAWVQALRLGADGSLTVPYIQTSAGFVVSAAEVTATTYLESLGNSLFLRDTAGSGGSLKLKTATTSTNDILTLNLSGASRSLTIAADATMSGTNTGDQDLSSYATVSNLALKAPLASPTFTGVPAAPTAAVDTNTTQLATMASVLAQAASATPLIDGSAAVGTSTRFARGDHVHPTDTTRAPLASPTFTGTPAGPTAAVDTNTTQIASTAFVIAQSASATPLIDGSAAVGTSTRFARSDHVHPTDTSRAALASPTFTGTPSAPTAAVDTNTTQLATMAAVLAQAASASPVADAASAVVGTSTRFARADHVHPLPKADILQGGDFAADAGANDTYTATLSPAITAYVTGTRYRFKANTANTGAATINFNSLGAKTIVKLAGAITTTLADNDIRAGQWVECVYDGTNMQMESQLGNAASGSGDVVAANPNAFTGRNTFSLVPELAWTSQSTGSQTYAINTQYYITTFNANSTATFSGTPVNGSTVTVRLIACDGTSTFTYPTAQRDGSSTATSTVITPTAGEHVFRFTYVNSLWYFADTVTGALNLAGGSTIVTGTLPVANGGTGITAFGTGIATALGVNTGSAGAPVLFNGAGGTPSSGTLTNCTGLPVSGITASTSTALGVGSIELGAASDTTVARVSAGVISVEGVTIDTISATNTLTNKRVTPRITSISSSATPAVNTDSCDCVTITALAAAITSMTSSLTGTPSNFDQLEYRILDNGTARAITWGASFASGTGTLPTTTTLGKALCVYLEWDSVQAKWMCQSTASYP